MLPPYALVAALMEFTVVSTAQWYGELIADFAPKCALLREPEMMGVRRAATAGEARLGAYELQMISISQPKRFTQRRNGLLSCSPRC